MKKNIFNLVIAAAFVFSACDTEKVDTSAGISRFQINLPQFSSPDGKSKWNGKNLFWEGNGSDAIFINGDKFRIVRESDGWYTVKDGNTESTEHIDTYFYIAYAGIGESCLDLSFDQTKRKYYVNMEEFGQSQYYGVPLTAKVSSNLVTLNPCCAIIHVKSNAGEEIVMQFNQDDYYEGDNETFVSSGYLNPATALFDEVDTYLDESYIPINDGDNIIVLPMEHNQETLSSISFDINGTYVGTTAPSILIKKGCYYTIDLTQM